MISGLFRTGVLYKVNFPRSVPQVLRFDAVELEKDKLKKSHAMMGWTSRSPYMEALWREHMRIKTMEVEKQVSKRIYRRNQIENRVLHRQYEANYPVEDYMCFQQLKETEGYLLAVFDGHGGPSLAEFSSSNIADYFENAIRKVKAESSKSSDLLELALLEAYDMLESGSLQYVRN